MKKTEMQPVNLLELKPVKRLEWETSENNCVVLLVPKFRNRFVVRWLVPMLKRPIIRVKLDERGSFVWQRCDGNMTIGKIGEEMSTKFSEPLDLTYDRIGKFVRQFVRDKFLQIDAA